ncbi:MAG: MFS transporter [Bryobacterales bacterium]|nr:MFS transporter [Bryobacterales bacterium]
MPTAVVEAPPVAATSMITPPAIPAKSLLGAVFLLGALLSFLGSVLPVWGYHRLEAFELAGDHFLAMALGFVLGNATTNLASLRFPRLFLEPLPGCVFSMAGVALIALLPPPYPLQWQLVGALLLGLALGSLTVVIFHHIGVVYRFNSPSVFQLSGLVAIAGVLATPLVVALVAIPAGSFALLAFAVLPIGIALGSMRKARSTAPPSMDPPQAFVKAFEDFRNPATLLLSLLLFFQLGNEVALLGWLPLFLIQRVGVSPEVAVYGLATFVFAILAGRTACQALRERARRNRVLLGGLSLSVLGCLMLLSTNNLFGAFLGLSLAGTGFAPVFPMALDHMARRFPYYHPGVMNAVFGMGLLGGLLAPFSLGFVAGKLGIGVVMALPIIGSILVAILVILLWLENRLTGLNP